MVNYRPFTVVTVNDAGCYIPDGAANVAQQIHIERPLPLPSIPSGNYPPTQYLGNIPPISNSFAEVSFFKGDANSCYANSSGQCYKVKFSAGNLTNIPTNSTWISVSVMHSNGGAAQKVANYDFNKVTEPSYFFEGSFTFNTSATGGQFWLEVAYYNSGVNQIFTSAPSLLTDLANGCDVGDNREVQPTEEI